MKNVNHKEIIEAIRHIIKENMYFIKPVEDYYEAQIFVYHIPQSVEAVKRAVIHEYDVIITYIHNVWDEETYGPSEHFAEVIEEFIMDNVAINFFTERPREEEIQGMLAVESDEDDIPFLDAEDFTTLQAIVAKEENKVMEAVQEYHNNLDHKKARKRKELQYTFNKEHSETTVRAESFRFTDLLDKTVDKLLDLYNDYKALYTVFKDETYQNHMTLIETALAAKEPKIKGGEL